MGSCPSFELGTVIGRECIVPPESSIASLMCGLLWVPISNLHYFGLLIELILRFLGSF